MYGEKNNKANNTFSYTSSITKHFGLATNKDSTHPHTCPSAHDIKVNMMQEVLMDFLCTKLLRMMRMEELDFSLEDAVSILKQAITASYVTTLPFCIAARYLCPFLP